MKERKAIDAQLHTIRSIARAAQDSRSRQEIETARFHLYSVFEGRDTDGARQWARALRVALLTIEVGEPRTLALAALGEIDQAIEDHGD